MRVVWSDNVRLKDQALRSSVFSIANVKCLGMMYGKLLSLNTTPRAIAGLSINHQPFLNLTGYVTLCPLESPLSNKDRKGQAVPYHLHSWVCAKSLLHSLAHFNIIINGLSIHLEQGLEVEQVMWLLLNKVTWLYSSVLWCYGDIGVEVHSSYVVIPCFKMKLLHSSDLSVCVLSKMILFDFCVKSAFSFFFKFLLVT